MTAGGVSFSGTNEAEAIDVSGLTPNCPFVRDYPIEYGAVGTFIGGMGLVCGGYLNDDSDACYSYDTQVGSWI